MKTWEETLAAATPLVEFLQRDSLFDAPYDSSTENVMVITDANVAHHFAAAQTDEFSDWQVVTNEAFPDSFEWDHNMHSRLRKKYNNYFSLEAKNFNGADDKFYEASNQVCCQLIELMLRDIKLILHCYANNYFPPIREKILYVYLHNGFPCGWNGHYPEGHLVVFSNF